MSRSKWKGPYVKKLALINNNKLKFTDRKSTILPKFIGSSLHIYNGKKFSKLLVLEEMVGHKVGELVMTRKSFSFKKKKSNLFIKYIKMQKNLLWNLQYCEKNKRENSFYLYKSLEIEKFIKRFFKIYKLIINDFKLKYSNSNLEIFVSYYTTMQSLKLLQKNLKVKSISIKSKPSYKSKILKTKINSKSRFKLISSFKQNLLTNSYSNNYVKITNNFSEILLESLSLFTKRKLNIKLILQNLNKGVSFRLKKNHSKDFKEILIKFRKFTKFLFFKETINVLMLVISKSVNLRLLTEFIAFQFSVIKRHNTFLIFLKQALFALQNSSFSRVKGIKIIVKGRLNGAPRARKSIVKIGSVPLQNFESKILTSKSISYTPNGTFSISAWSCVI